MTCRLAAILSALCTALAAQDGTPPKAHAEEYPVHASLEKLAIGAEYLVHSFSGRGQTFVANHYLVVEVAVFPAKGDPYLVNAGHFSLRVNAKKQLLQPQAPEFVAADLKYPDWESNRRLEVGAGPIILGRPDPVERFPGDPQAQPPRVPKVPTTPNPGGHDKESPVRAEELVIQTALQEGETRRPVSGYLYFAYSGNIKHIRSLELEYTGPLGGATLPLF